MRKAGEKINSDSNNYKNIVESLPVSVIIFTLEGKVLYTNKKALELFAVKESEVNSVNIYDFVSSDFLNIVQERKKNLLAGEELPSIEIKTKNKKNKTIFVEIKTSSIIYNDTEALQTIITDITLSKQLQEEKIKAQLAEEINLSLKKEIDLRTQSEQKLKAIFESGTQLMWTVNKNIALTSFNQNYNRAIFNSYGKYPEINTDLTKPKAKFAPDSYHAFWNEKYAEAFSGKTTEFETETKGKEGERIFRHITLHPIYNNNKEVVEVAGQAYDITQKKIDEKEIISKQSQLEAIINTTDDIIFSVDKNYNISEFNQVLQQVVKERHNLEIKPGQYVFDILPTVHHEAVKARYDIALMGERVLAMEKFIMNGTERIYEAYYNPIKINGEVTGVAVFSKDVTDRYKAQQDVHNKQSQLTTIINTTNDIIFSMDRNYNVVQYNSVLEEIAEQRSGKKLRPGMNFFDFLPPETHEWLRNTYNRALNGENVISIETFFHPKSKINRTYEANYNPIVINGEIIGISVFSRDITEQKEIEKQILNTQSQLSAIINNTTDIVVSIDKTYHIVQFNKLLAEMVKKGSGRELKEGTYILDIIDPAQHGNLISIYEQVFSEGKHVVATEMFSVSDNKKLYFETNYNPIKQDGETVGIAIFSRDISEKINSETELREALKEKEVLLKEVHHRVKNNLQVISSILNLQTGYLKDKATINILKECQNRIKTMAYIHESLYQTKDFLQINFGEYIVNLVKNLFYSYDANQQKIKANFDVDTIFLNLDTSIPCGLIINELVSNAFKYAFSDGREGFISVKVKKTEDNKIKMQVTDNGRGMPANIDFRKTESLGLQLVNILSEQINATLTLNQTNGTTFEIIF